MIYLLLSPWVLWGIYCAVMRLKQVREANALTTSIKVMGYPWLFFGLFVDFVVNTIFGSLVFLDLPREWTLSSRLWRLSNLEPSWRQKWALWIRINLLDPIDPSGIHKG
ncbi:hypothetical protein QFZ42_003306 [Variovorax paradoxus]|uniref:hypothetical protein n=1 Tax=Variovorax paradoxus TaxID=34073 RepID=UPI0027936FEF|nr:hypothetical protein [Variovorax paradoxus]MDQ0571472.1 hypothetical protein [Variovorax paradoxus]